MSQPQQLKSFSKSTPRHAAWYFKPQVIHMTILCVPGGWEHMLNCSAPQQGSAMLVNGTTAQQRSPVASGIIKTFSGSNSIILEFMVNTLASLLCTFICRFSAEAHKKR